jgi:hypothetical protein
MNEPHGRKVKYDDGAQMTDTHKSMRPIANLSGCPAIHNSYKPHCNRRPKGDRHRTMQKKPAPAKLGQAGTGRSAAVHATAADRTLPATTETNNWELSHKGKHHA